MFKTIKYVHSLDPLAAIVVTLEKEEPTGAQIFPKASGLAL